jgi:hypothetical protein
MPSTYPTLDSMWSTEHNAPKQQPHQAAASALACQPPPPPPQPSQLPQLPQRRLLQMGIQTGRLMWAQGAMTVRRLQWRLAFLL